MTLVLLTGCSSRPQKGFPSPKGRRQYRFHLLRPPQKLSRPVTHRMLQSTPLGDHQMLLVQALHRINKLLHQPFLLPPLHPKNVLRRRVLRHQQVKDLQRPAEQTSPQAPVRCRATRPVVVCWIEWAVGMGMQPSHVTTKSKPVLTLLRMAALQIQA